MRRSALENKYYKSKRLEDKETFKKNEIIVSDYTKRKKESILITSI